MDAYAASNGVPLAAFYDSEGDELGLFVMADAATPDPT